MSIEDNSIYGSGDPESTPIEPCTKTITEEGEGELGLAILIKFLILPIILIFVILFLVGWSDG